MTENTIGNLFKPEQHFWQDKRVFMTGHTGFKGSWMTVWLAQLGANTTGYALTPETTPNMFDMLKLSERCRHVVGDIRDLETLTSSIREFQPEIVIHMAAQALVRRSYKNPLETFEVNITGTANLLEACRNVKTVRAILVVTSDKCYENREWDWSYRETDRLGGRDPYSASKACAELVTSAYRQSFFHPDAYNNHGVSLASARAGNVFGGGDWSEDRLIPDAVRSFSQGNTLVLRHPWATRPWQHVLEPLLGYLMLLRACFEQGSPYAQAWNFGPEQSSFLPVTQLMERFAQQWGQGTRWRPESGRNALHEAKTLFLDSLLANRLLGWRPAISIDRAIAATAAWYKTYYQGISSEALYNLTVTQIRTYADEVAKRISGSSNP